MAATRLKIYNDALLFCGERTLASLTEDVEPRHLLDHVWNSDGVQGCLEEAQWHFAIRTVQIDYDPDEDPQFGYNYAFTKPSDWVLTSALCSDEYFKSPLLGYWDEAGFWYADLQTIYVRYISNDVDYGMDLSLWPRSFSEFVAAHFAYKITPKITGDKDRFNAAFWAFNRGLISSLGLSRQDIKRVAMGASIMINWIPRVLGSMSLRPGLKYIGATYLNHRVKFLPFIFSTADTALIEVTDLIIRIWINDALITRPAVTAAITNGTFAANINSWTDADDSGATSSWNASGYMQLVGNGTARAIRYQQVTVNEPGVEHALRVTVTRGPLTMKVGSTVNGDDYVRETIIGAGTHSLAFTPSSNFYVQFESSRISMILIDSCTLEASGIMTLPSLWPEARLGSIRATQS